MLGSKKPGWRPFVLVSLLIVLAMVVTGCKKDTPEPGAVEDTAVPAEDTAVPAEDTEVPMVSEFSEAPMLADLVASGDLPPVEERLPVNPLVTVPYDSVGEYGGTMYTASWWNESGNVQL